MCRESRIYYSQSHCSLRSEDAPLPAHEAVEARALFRLRLEYSLGNVKGVEVTDCYARHAFSELGGVEPRSILLYESTR